MINGRLENIIKKIDARLKSEQPDLSPFIGRNNMERLAAYNGLPEKVYHIATSLGRYSGPKDREDFSPGWPVYIPIIGPIILMLTDRRKYVLDSRYLHIELKQNLQGEFMLVRDKRLKKGEDVVFVYSARFMAASKDNPLTFYDPGDWENDLEQLR